MTEGSGPSRQVWTADAKLSPKQAEMLNSLTAWATRSDKVSALVLTGSLARRDGLADDVSDLDIEIIANDPSWFVAEDRWLAEMGGVITVLRLDEGQEWSTRLAIFDKGVKVDFTIADVRRVRNMVEGGTLIPLYDRGYRVIVDKAGVTSGLPDPSYLFPVPSLPSRQHFRERVEEFWFEAFHVPKYLARNELFLVKQRDWTMKGLLLEMMEWHAIAISSNPVDVWHNGTRVQEWTDPETWRQSQVTFGRFDAEDAYRAFQETIRLYGRLGREVANRTGYNYPQDVEERILPFA
jgi:aminoglycoside 6-adenylyltransferase